MEKKLTVLFADDCPVFRAGLRQTFKGVPYLLDFKEAATYDEFLSATGQQQPKIVLLNMALHVENKLTITQLSGKLRGVKIIILYDAFHKRYIQRILNEPVQGFIFKSSPRQEFLLALEHVLNNGVYYCHETSKLVSSFLLQSIRTANNVAAPASFTLKEKQIIGLICEEFTAKEIADKLCLSKRTVENRKIKILEKMHVKNMAGIVAFAYRNNLVSIVSELDNV